MDYKKAAAYWTEREADSKKLDRPDLLGEIENFITAHNTCALATADLSGFVRCTPIEYTYMDGCFWLLSEGGLKFKGLEVNKNRKKYKKSGDAVFDKTASRHRCERWGYENDTTIDNLKGICADCGKILPDTDHRFCADCRQARRAKAKERLRNMHSIFVRAAGPERKHCIYRIPVITTIMRTTAKIMNMKLCR